MTISVRHFLFSSFILFTFSSLQDSGPSMALLFSLQVIAKGRILFSGKKQVPIPQHESEYNLMEVKWTSQESVTAKQCQTLHMLLLTTGRGY